MASEGEESEQLSHKNLRRSPARDIRRYYCEFCGICRSKKSLIAAHTLAHHKDELGSAKAGEVESEKGGGGNKCDDCGASFKKPAHLQQHMISHSTERPFQCPVNDCCSSYQRKDHLNRHVLKHEGKLFACPIENCKSKFTIQGNMMRHVKELHGDRPSCLGAKQHICPEEGCGKVFKHASKLKKHEDLHVKLDTLEAICGEPGCMKVFTNSDFLKEHIKSSHQYVKCEICGTKQLKKNFKRHQRQHEGGAENERIKCSVEHCKYTFSNRSNLNTHVRAVHIELRTFACRFSGCRKKFPYKHVRDNHENSSAHVCIQGDFLETDEQFRARPRGGRKRKSLPAESLLRKRIAPPDQSSKLDLGTDYLRWLLSDDNNE